MTTAWLENTRIVWIVSILAGVLFLFTNLPLQLDDYDQAKQAYTSFEMIKEGHWLYQHTPHERIATKPPLVGWISAGIFSVTRSWALAWRLPSLGAAVALSILLFRAGGVYGAIGSLFATSAFVFNLLTPRLATLVRTDMPLALVIFAIGLLVWNKLRKQQEWNSRDRLSVFALLTAAMLIKGPIVYAFLLPGIVAFQIWRRGVGSARCADRTPQRGVPTIWCGWWPWLASLSLFVLWAVGGSTLVPGFYDQVVVREFLGRFGETIHRPQPLLFYLPHLLHKFSPWSVLMITLIILDFRAFKLDRFKRSSFLPRLRVLFLEFEPQTFWVIYWIVGGLIVMSIIPSKRVDRIFPIIPPLCLLLAVQIGNGREGSPSRPGLTHPSSRCESHRHRSGVLAPYLRAALFLAILFAGSYSAFKVYTGYRDHRDALVRFGRIVRQQSSAYHWRYEVLKSNEEGLLLYLDKTHFLAPERAITEWKEGKLDALVVPAKDSPKFLRDLCDAALSQFRSVGRNGETDSYVLITR